MLAVSAETIGRTAVDSDKGAADAAPVVLDIDGVGSGCFVCRFTHTTHAPAAPMAVSTTRIDSFWMGVPVVTRIGATAVARGGFCQLSNLGLAELAAESEDGFVSLATALAADRGRIGLLRRSLRDWLMSSPLTDAPRFAANIEAAYRQMWQAWSATAGRSSPAASGPLDLRLSVGPKSPETMQVREAS